MVLLTVASVGFNAATTPPATLAAPDGADVVVHGHRVHYRQWGTTGPQVLLVHGFAEHTVSWEPMADELARTHRVTAVDLAGYGYTAYDGNYSLADQAELVTGVMAALHLDRPVLVGHSAGAAVVGAVALAQPHSVRGVVFADGDALPFGDPDAPQHPRATWPLRTPWFTSLYRIGTRTGWIDRAIVRRTCGSQCDGFNDQLVAAWLRPMRQGDAEQALASMGSNGMLALRPAQVRAIRVPRAIIWGAEDATGGGSLDGCRANLGHPPERILAHAGHLSQLAKPAEFAHAVAELTDPMR